MNQSLFDQYVDWADVNSLSINVTKTKNMTLCSKYKMLGYNEKKTQICKGDSIVGHVQSYTYLGVDIDSMLSFDIFLKSTIRKVNYILYLFSKIRYVLTLTAAILVYRWNYLSLTT